MPSRKPSTDHILASVMLLMAAVGFGLSIYQKINGGDITPTVLSSGLLLAAGLWLIRSKPS
jgi:hypothetical protein